MSGNFYLNQAQNALRDAYDNDALYAFKVLFPSGKGFKFGGSAPAHRSSGTNGVVAATFSLRLKGKPVSFVVPLAFVKNLDKTLTVNTGALLTMSVSANGERRRINTPGRRMVSRLTGRRQTPSVSRCAVR